ncbi:MAG: hypothetical protein Kow0063_21180 [Anaerolineae bacterium]
MSKANRLSRKQRREEERARQRLRSRLIWLAAGVLTVVLLAGVVGWSVWKQNQPEPGEVVPIQGQQHITPGQSHPPYNSDPPTSGWHYAEPARAGFYDTPLADEQLIHNLEHGHVVIFYDCDRLADCETVKAELRGLVDHFQRWKIVAVARENADAAIALTAWGRIDKMDAYDEDRIVAFVRRWRNQGPENTPE